MNCAEVKQIAACLELTMPWPQKVLSPNARVHWARKARAAKALKEAWFFQAKEQGAHTLKADKLDVSLTFHCPDRRARDLDNMLGSCKAGLDGLSLALGVDDSKWNLSISRASTIGGFVKVRVTQVWTKPSFIPSEAEIEVVQWPSL